MAGLKAILGLGSPFATRWELALLIGPFVFVAYWAMNGLVVGLFDPSTVITYPILVFCGPASVFLGAMFLIHQRYCFPDIRFAGAFDCNAVIALPSVPVGKIRSFGPFGPKYEVGQALRQLDDRGDDGRNGRKGGVPLDTPDR